MVSEYMKYERYKHCLGVATVMEKFVKDFHIVDTDMTSEEAFMLGIIHDMGYNFSDADGHAHTMGQIMKDSDYKYWKEIYYHGVYDTEYNSPELLLLNAADMLVTASGEIVSFESRLNDIGNRHGFESQVYKDCKNLVDSLQRILGDPLKEAVHSLLN